MLSIEGPECPICGCHSHAVESETMLKCNNCRNRWEILSAKEKAELEVFVKKICKEMGWTKKENL